MEIVARPNQGVLIEMVNGDEAKLRALIIDTINQQGSIYHAAKALGVTNTSIHYWIKRLNIDVSTKAE